MSVRASLDGTPPYTTALLVDYGTATRAIAGTVQDTSRLVCYGEGVPGDTGCAYRTKHRTETTDFKIVTRGWLDVRNRDSAPGRRRSSKAASTGCAGPCSPRTTSSRRGTGSAWC